MHLIEASVMQPSPTRLITDGKELPRSVGDGVCGGPGWNHSQARLQIDTQQTLYTAKQRS